jgi:hypothetical protein
MKPIIRSDENPIGVCLRLERHDVGTFIVPGGERSRKRMAGDRWTLGPTWYQLYRTRFNVGGFFPDKNDDALRCTLDQAQEWAASQIAMTTDLVVTGWTGVVPELAKPRFEMEVIMSDGSSLTCTVANREAADSMISKLYETNGVLQLHRDEQTTMFIPACRITKLTRKITHTPVPNLAAPQS